MKSREEELKALQKEYQNVKAPEDGIENMKKRIEQAKFEKEKEARHKRKKSMSIGIAAAVAILFILPNTSPNIAYAMERIPLLGKVFEVVTIRDFQYHDEHNNAEVKVPEVKEGAEDADAISKTNQMVKAYTDQLLEEFKKEMNETGEGYQGLDVSYKVVTNTDTWFTLDIAALKVQASGYEFHKYYHINKVTGEMATLQDLFKKNSDYASIISENIKQQMKDRMQKNQDLIYWVDEQEDPQDAFKGIDKNQNFYFDKDHNLVIVFDEYAVSPGFMGVQEFTIQNKVLEKIRA